MLQPQNNRVVGWLVVLGGKGSDIADHFRVRNGSNLIGRQGSPVDIAIKDNQMSPRHAVLLHRNGQFRITDLDSCHGTRLDGRFIDTADIKDGDVLVLGSTTLEFRKSTLGTHNLR